MSRRNYAAMVRMGASFLALAGASAPAFAQQEAPLAPAAESQGGEIVVTGTRLRTPNLESPSPITSLDSQAIGYVGKTSVQEIVAEVGALVGSDTESEISTGENSLNLRNLGPSRTLVLVDGQRFVGGFPGSSAVDTNVIPSALIERIDVLTGGASAIYGADAVTGVVNFILRKDFEGIAVEGRYGDAQLGDFRDQVYSVTVGHNFDDGAGNLTFNYTFGDRPLTLATARPESSTEVNEQINNLDGPNPRFVLRPGTRESFFTDGGARIDPFEIFSDGFNGDGTPFRHGVNVGSFAGTGEIGGDGIPNWRLFAQGIRPANRRHIFTLSGHYDYGEAFKPYFDVHYSNVRLNAVDQESLTVGMPVARDNAFLPASVVNAAPAGAPIFFNRWDLDSGFSNSVIRKETTRVVFGARGDLTPHLSYNVSANFGEVERRETTTNNRMFDRYIAAIDSVIDPSTGRAVCRSDLDPSSFNRLGTDALVTSFNPALGAVTFTPGRGSGCVPFNPFTTNNAVNDAARAWIWIPTVQNVRNRQTVLQGYLTADSGAFFELPGGPIRVVAGGEYRRESSRSDFDEFSGSPRTVGFVAGLDLAGRFNVKEAFGEISLPLLADMGPWVRRLTIDGAFRFSDYSTIGSTTTWKVGASFATIGGLTLRGTLSSAVRAPNIQELFEPRTNTSTSLGQFDPCSTTNVSLGTSTRRANCETALRALGVDPATFDPRLGTFFAATTGGNPDLQEETAKTLTAGFLWQPRFIPGLTVSADYFDIRLENAVLRPNTTAIFNACYDAPTLDNVFCPLLQREAGTGFATSVEIQSVNVAELRTSGIEFMASYVIPTESFGRFRATLSGTWLDRLDIQKTPLPVLTDDLGLFNTDTGGSSPRWVLNFDLGWSFGKWDANYGFNYSSPTLRPPLINAQRANADSFIDDPYVNAFVNHDIQIGYEIRDDARIYFGIQNLTDEYPDQVRGSVNGPSGRQGFAGRTFYAGFRIGFDAFQ